MITTVRGGRGGGRGGSRTVGPPRPAFELDFGIVEHERVRPARPGAGTRGKKIRMVANSYQMIIPDKDCYHYDVEIRPETMPPVNRRIFETWKKVQGSEQAQLAVYDGRKNLYVPNLIPMDDEGQELEVLLTEENSDRTQKFMIKVKKVDKVIHMEAIHHFINSKKEVDLPREALTILDLLLAARPNALFTAVNKKTGSSFYKQYEPQFNISGGLNMRQGWKQSVKYTYKEVLLNLDVACTAFYRHGPLLELVAGFFNKNRPQDINPRQVAPGTIEFQRLSKFLSNVNVEITYRTTGRLKYKIRGLSKQTPDKAVITRDDGTKLTVMEYFQKEFNIRIQYPFLPLVMCGNEGQVLLPMECLKVKEGQRHIGKLSEVQTADVIKITAVPPPERQDRIREGREVLHGREQDPLLSAWGVKMNSRMKEIEGRVLQAPVLTGSTNISPQNGAYDLSKTGSCKFFRPAKMEHWAVAVFGDTRNMPFDSMADFLTKLFSDCVNRGMVVSSRNFKDVIVPQRRMSVEETLIEANKKAIEASLGGVNMIVDPAKMLNVLGKPIPTMVMGADVTHPPAGAQGGVSIASLVASMDSKFAEYRAGIKVQGPREEIISDLTGMVGEHLSQFQARAKGRLPERLLFFRDGVSEGQFGEVALQEVQKLKLALRAAGAGNCKLTFLVINKRHSHRFFCQESRDADRKGNVMAGTVIDSGITHPFEFDFFLNSHTGLQGTSRAAHYHVLYDENNFSADDLQEICYRMCYLFARASRSVSIVPAVYYAHLVAYRARCYRPGGVGDHLRWLDRRDLAELSRQGLMSL
ncbi:Piwi-domain-containing protein [Rhizoclosmatium globosum]|uniref:Piwi-domain-containing protein n=1 Tax=Rhizoclosmatium globosum TaxID=329046 RepID=A0A1Y2BQR5_9FUNG|nr:Piwi-domain-containing protein [Rhizoclosmatium globosum]|eukprot:ORY36495.1 Piwi-domain-containing protein [Rhizoclosmatium globosum]